MNTIKITILTIALCLAFAGTVSSQSNQSAVAKPSSQAADPKNPGVSAATQTNHSSNSQPVAKPVSVPVAHKTAVQGRTSGNAHPHTPRTVQPNEAIYKKPAPAQK